MSNQGSMFSIIYQSGWLSILVLLVLLLMSVVSWAVILRKSVYVSGLTRRSRAFLRGVNFKNGLPDLIVRAEQHPDCHSSRLFLAAYRAFSGSGGLSARDGSSRQQLLLMIERNIEKAVIDEKSRLEKELGLLATISSSAPFIGLLGTVTGIIDAFYSIAAQGASSIAVVAPGISGALVATAAGLFTAIPALIAYNTFREKARALSNEMNGFGLEVMSLLDRSLDDTSTANEEQFPEIKLGKRKN